MKKIHIFFISFSFLFLICFCFTLPNSNAFSTKDNKDFSQFVNLNKSGTYTKEITVQTINEAEFYEIATEFQTIYGETYKISDDMYYKKQSNYGFKINGEFFTESYTIDKSGTYLIQVHFFSTSNKISSPSSKAIEEFTIKVDLDMKLEMIKKTFYFEHYSYLNDFLNDVSTSMNLENVVLSSNSRIMLTEAFNSYITIRKNDENYVADKIESNIILTFDNFNEEFPVTIKSIRSSDIEPINWEQMLSKNEDLVIDTNKYYSYIGNNLKDIEDINQEIINLKMNVPEGHLIKIDFECNITMPSVSYSGVSNDYIIKYNLTDVGTGSIHSFNRKVFFYNGNLNTDTEKPNIEYIDNLVIKQNDLDFDYLSLISNVYDILNFNGVNYHSVFNIKSITVDKSKVDIFTPGKYDVIFTCIDNSNNTKTDTISVEVIDSHSPKVLAKYNKIYISKDDKEFLNQIKIIDNYKVDDSKTKYTFVEESENGGYIIIYAEDYHGNSTEEIVRFTYEKNLSFFEKVFVLPFYNIKKFIINIFS